LADGLKAVPFKAPLIRPFFFRVPNQTIPSRIFPETFRSGGFANDQQLTTNDYAR